MMHCSRLLAWCVIITLSSGFSPTRRHSPLFSSQSVAPFTAGLSATVATTPAQSTDDLNKFAQDLSVVLKKLRGQDADPTLPPVFRNPRELSYTSTWTDADWVRHNSRWRFIDYITTFPTSRMLRRIAPQLLTLTTWSIIACWLCSKEISFLHKIALPLTPLSLVSTFVAALLTLRSNQGLSRLNEGRLAFGKVILYTRDIAQLIYATIYSKDKYLGLKLARHVSVFGWLLKNFVRGNDKSGVQDIVNTMLPEKADAEYVLRQRKKPVAVVTRLRQVIHHVAEEGQLSNAEEKALDHTTLELNHCVTTCERIKASPIPPLYTAHAGRLLMFYLFFLPLALKGAKILSNVGTVTATAAVGFAMFGLDEISHLMEQPFRYMPLFQLCKNSMTDVGDAFVCEPPPLTQTTNDEDVKDYKDPPYW